MLHQLDLTMNRAAQERRRWYVVRTAPHREFGAMSQLRQQGFSGTFLPIHWKTVRHARKFRKVRAPIFPRYLFLSLDLGRDRWRSVNSTFGVAGMIMEGERPKAVPRGVVEALQEISDRSGLISFSPLMAAGDKVEVKVGPFAGQVAELLQIDEQDRVKILLKALGGQIVVSMRGHSLSPVN